MTSLCWWDLSLSCSSVRNVLFVLCSDWRRTNILLISDAPRPTEAPFHLNNQHTRQFPLKVCVRATINMAVASHRLVEQC